MIDHDDESIDSSRDSQRQKVCVDCGTLSPPTAESFTMISSRFGWRLTRTSNASGDAIIEWRCPSCYARLKGRADPSKKRA
jgi:ribosomal protein L40E